MQARMQLRQPSTSAAGYTLRLPQRPAGQPGHATLRV